MAAPDFVDNLLKLWELPPPAGDAARAAFAQMYTDPVRINGIEMRLDDLVARARALHVALSERRTEILSRVDEGDRVAVAFRMHGKHTGPLITPLGEVAGSGKEVSTQVIDVLVLSEGKIREIWMVADTLGQLMQLDAVSLKSL
jgi:predicted ester cyclase